MEKDRNTRVLAITALILGVLGISLGFAAVASQLTIQSSAEVNPVDDFHIYFSSESNGLETNTVAGVPSSADVEVTNATIDNTTNDKHPTIRNLHAKFTQPGQNATYTFYAFNDNDYDGYLTSLIFASTTPTCTARNAAHQSAVDGACPGLSVSISIGSNIVNQKTSLPNITSHALSAKSTEPIVVKIEYASNAKKAPGPFDVTFGDITLTYDTSDN